MTTAQANRSCPQCKQPLPADAPEGLCPECLMLGGLETMPLPEGYKPSGRLPEMGETFGDYRIGRELGRGGMGAVFEAEQLETGRRVALKLLNHQLDSPESRARFLREGRLAASINHPNSVYVFGTEEIGEMPAIVMELVNGGTLEERVKNHGALCVGEAVDAVLQIIEGLSAAKEIGILHRDVKPGNCFEDEDGTVKIGDFGLSISTEARDEKHLTMEGAVFGTPAFSSPEQLRGDELNVRSDIYAVGATLFYLLTGRPAFRGKSLAQLFANVLEGPTPSAKEVRPDLPADLVAIVTRCLQKMPAERYGSYADLRKALSPFGSGAPVPAPLPLRFGAAVIDWMAYLGLSFLAQWIFFGSTAFIEDYELGFRRNAILLGLGLWTLYFGLPEGRRGASLGKMICRLRIVNSVGTSPGFFIAALRALLILVPASLPAWIFFIVSGESLGDPENPWPFIAVSVSFYGVLGLLFSSARRRNQYASVVDLLTATRVVVRRRFQQRPDSSRGLIEPVSTADDTPRIGPFHVLETLGDDWSVGYDSRLLRKVWIRKVPAGSTAVDAKTRQMGRPGRLRWLVGRRSEEESWDAFEYPGGRSIHNQIKHQVPSWSRVRYWLLDILEELEFAQKESEELPVLSLDRLWITESGRAKLLDFPVAETSPDTASEQGLEVGEFVDKVAGLAELPIPIHAAGFRATAAQQNSPTDLLNALRPLLQRATRVTAARRIAMVGGCLAFPILAAMMSLLGMKTFESWHREAPEVMELYQLISHRDLKHAMAKFMGEEPESDRLFEIFIAVHYADLISDPKRWNGMPAKSMITGPERRFAEQSLRKFPNPTAEEIAEADALLAPKLAEIRQAGGGLFGGLGVEEESELLKWAPGFVGISSLLIYVVIPAICAALFFRKGLMMLACGVSVARKDGSPAPRWRCLWRSLIAWSPLLIAVPCVVALVFPLAGLTVTIALSVVVATVPVIVSLCFSERSLQDRLAGTYLVPK